MKKGFKIFRVLGSSLLAAVVSWGINWLFFCFGIPVDWRLILEIINTKMFLCTFFIALAIVGSVQLKLDERYAKKGPEQQLDVADETPNVRNSDDTMDRMAGSFAGMNLDPEKEEKPKNPIGKFYFGKTSRRGNIKRIIRTEKNIMEDRMRGAARQKSKDDGQK